MASIYGYFARRIPNLSLYSNVVMREDMTDEQRIRVSLAMLPLYEMFLTQREYPVKSTSAAESWLQEAKADFAGVRSSFRIDESIVSFTRCIVYAPPGSEVLAMGYAGRSTVLLCANLYRDCLQDISRALNLPCPDNLKLELYVKRARCLIALETYENCDYKKDIAKALEEAAKYSGQMTNDAVREYIKEQVENPDRLRSFKDPYKKWLGEAQTPQINSENPELKGVSSALALRYTNVDGRYMAATRNIQAGEVVAVLKPYAASVYPTKALTHCGHCMEQAWSAIPCDKCCRIVYCNEECKKKDYEQFHDIECQVIHHLNFPHTASQGPLSLRVFIKALKEAQIIGFLREKIRDIDSRLDERTKGFTNGILDENNCACMYALMTDGAKQRPFQLREFLLYAILATVTLAMKTYIFGVQCSSREDIDRIRNHEDFIFVAQLILRSIKITATNSRIVTEVHHSFTNGLTPVNKALVIHPMSYFNHSCFSSLTKIDYGLNTALYANFKINEDTQVFITYHVDFDDLERTERREILFKEYGFMCDCRACKEKWPTFDRMPDNIVSVGQSRRNKLIRLFDKCGSYDKLHSFKSQLQDLIDPINQVNYTTKFIQSVITLPSKQLMSLIWTRKQLLLLTGNRLQTHNASPGRIFQTSRMSVDNM